MLNSSTRPQPPPSRPLRVNINDLLNPVRPSPSEAASPASLMPSPANVSAHTPALPRINTLDYSSYDQPLQPRFSSYRDPTAHAVASRMQTGQGELRHSDGHHYMDARLGDGGHATMYDKQAHYSLRSAHWASTSANENENSSRIELPPLRELKTEPWQTAPLSASPYERPSTGDARTSTSAPNRPPQRPSIILPSPSPLPSVTRGANSPGAGPFSPSHLNSTAAMMAIPHSPYGQYQHQSRYPAPSAMVGPQMYAHQTQRPHLVPLVRPSEYSPIAPSPLTPLKLEQNASVIMGAVDANAARYQSCERASVRIAARGSKTPTQDDSPFVLQLHPTEQPQQNAKQGKRTHTDANFENEGNVSPAPRSSVSSVSSLSSLSSMESGPSGSGGQVADDAPKAKKAKGKAKDATTTTSVNTKGASKKTKRGSKKRSGSEESGNGNDAVESSKPSRKGKEKEKAVVSAPQAFSNGYEQPLDPSVTKSMGYGVGVVPVRPEAAFSYFPFKYAPYPPPLNMKLYPEMQFARCMSARYKMDPFPRCVSCTRRWAGDTCRFQNIRILLRDANKLLCAIGFQDLNASRQADEMKYPNTWNVRLEKEHVDRTMMTVAQSLLRHLQKENAHQKHGGIVKRDRETDVRATCDTCMTSLFSSSWMCRSCGREACDECYQTIRRLTGADPTPAASPAAEKGSTTSSISQRTMKERHAQSNPFFLACSKKTEHGVHTFIPVTRFVKGELEYAITEMERLVRKDDGGRTAGDGAEGNDRTPKEAMTGKVEEIENGENGVIGMDIDATASSSSDIVMQNARDSRESEGAVNGPSDNSSQAVEAGCYDDGICTLVRDPVPPRSEMHQPTSHLLPTTSTLPGSPSWPVPYYTAETLTESIFAGQWSQGRPLVVTGVLKRFNISWTPEYFMNTYGAQPCIILECQSDNNNNKKVNVAEFFSSFGKYEGRTDCWKLKDWPPSTDFKTAFPELYEDFSRAVPIPNYTRRDGVLNIASHFPTNTIVPDLGPKMYNAYASSDTPGSKGSTRLHMDMADAVNIMLHSEPTADGAPGCAAWDIFRAEDSRLLRKFFKKNFKGKYQNDPIHAQTFYLDPELRKQLFDEFGVKSFRIYQRPGEAVFIPAGCAHQVCNLADCIKVACDFVSLENVERCENLTREFREQNQSLVWKEDVLQLRSMMWFAWLSCRQQQQKWQSKDNTRSGLTVVASASSAE